MNSNSFGRKYNSYVFDISDEKDLIVAQTINIDFTIY